MVIRSEEGDIPASLIIYLSLSAIGSIRKGECVTEKKNIASPDNTCVKALGLNAFAISSGPTP